MPFSKEDIERLSSEGMSTLEQQKNAQNDDPFPPISMSNSTYEESDSLYVPPDEILEPSVDKVDNSNEELWSGGPTQVDIGLWQKQFPNCNIFAGRILEDWAFVIRTLERIEYKKIVAIPDSNAFQREELICETCVLWPKNWDFKTQAKEPAGIPSTVASIIMQRSGFTEEYEITQIK